MDCSDGSSHLHHIVPEKVLLESPCPPPSLQVSGVQGLCSRQVVIHKHDSCRYNNHNDRVGRCIYLSNSQLSPNALVVNISLRDTRFEFSILRHSQTAELTCEFSASHLRTHTHSLTHSQLAHHAVCRDSKRGHLLRRWLCSRWRGGQRGSGSPGPGLPLAPGDRESGRNPPLLGSCLLPPLPGTEFASVPAPARGERDSGTLAAASKPSGDHQSRKKVGRVGGRAVVSLPRAM